ncbi:MAG TPA: DUF739 family protein [Tissierellia bacterium]|nr:DUF739 family protein [Tissierellia bacterium]
MAFDYSKLRGRITEKYGNEGNFAKAIGFARSTLSFKLNNKVYWTQPEINLACQLLDIEDSEVTSYFFKPKVQEAERKEA